MTRPDLAVQKAIVAALTGAPGVPPVYDQPDDGTEYPYVTIASRITADERSFSTRRDRGFTYLSVWSTYPGQAEVHQILAGIDAALDGRRLALETGRMLRIRVVRTRTVQEPDGRTWQGQVTLEDISEHGS